MADEEGQPTQSTKFRLGDRLVDAWGNDVEEDDAAPDYSKQNSSDLQGLIDQRNADREPDDEIVVEGTGKDGKVLKKDLVAALEADDEAHADDEEE